MSKFTVSCRWLLTFDLSQIIQLLLSFEQINLVLCDGRLYISAMEVSVKTENTVIISEREAKIIQLISDGKTAKQAAADMGIRPRTMDYIINKLRDDLDCRTTSHLVATFLRKKIIE